MFKGNFGILLGYLVALKISRADHGGFSLMNLIILQMSSRNITSRSKVIIQFWTGIYFLQLWEFRNKTYCKM